MGEYIPNKDFLSIIDKQLNRLEFYFRAKWNKYQDKTVAIQKYSRKGPKDTVNAHLVIYDLKSFTIPILTMKYTTMLYRAESTAENPIDKDNFYLRIPRGKAQYEKTWGGCDYIIGEYLDKETSTSAIFYFNREKLFEFLSLREASVSANYRKYLQDKSVSIEDVYQSEDTGFDVRFLERLGIVEHKDFLSLKDGYFVEVLKSNCNKDKCYFINRWKGFDGKAYWPNFQLKGLKDWSKEIVVTRLDNADISKTFKSIVEAAKYCFGAEYTEGKEANIRNVLKGRAKSFKANNYSFKAEYSSL